MRLSKCRVQFTPLRKGLRTVESLLLSHTYFNSRPCERGFVSIKKFGQTPQISIHAPARGASSCRAYIKVHEDNFNSRPCERGFKAAEPQFGTSTVFQFTPLREGLQSLASFKYCSLFISKLPTPISNGGLILAPPGHFSGSARGGISQYHFYWLPPKEGSTTLFRPRVYHFLLVL